MKTTARVKNNVWDVDDEYLTVEVQVSSLDFKAGQRVRVSIEKLGDGYD